MCGSEMPPPAEMFTQTTTASSDANDEMGIEWLSHPGRLASEEWERLRKRGARPVSMGMMGQDFAAFCRAEKVLISRQCLACKGTGDLGRTAITELLVVDESLRDFILERAPAATIRRHVAPKMQTMRQVGWLKVARGITTAEEVLRAVQAEELFEGTINAEHP